MRAMLARASLAADHETEHDEPKQREADRLEDQDEAAADHVGLGDVRDHVADAAFDAARDARPRCLCRPGPRSLLGQSRLIERRKPRKDASSARSRGLPNRAEVDATPILTAIADA